MKPLDGIKVIEMTSWMAAPSAGAILADMGADVIKVEPPKGDPMRGMTRRPKVDDARAGVDPGFAVDNRGKRSITVAVDTAEGAEVVHRLLAEADIFLTNLLTHRQQRYGLDPDSLKTVNPKLVHATLTGYGLGGPEAERPGYDVTAFYGRGGVSESMTEPDRSPPPVPRAGGDHTTGLALVGSILAALRLVERTGEMQVVDVSLLTTALWTMATDVAPSLVDGHQPRVRDRHNQLSPLANRYPCAEGRWVVLNMPEAHWWPRFCTAIGDEAMGVDPEFDSAKKRFDRCPELVDRIDALMSTRTVEEWGAIFDEAGLIWAPIQTAAQTVTDPQVRAIGAFVEIEHPADGTRFETLASPIRIVGSEIGPERGAPALGADTDVVLGELGMSAADIAALRASGSIGD